MQLYHCRVTTAIGDEKMNEYGCVLVKVVLQTQAVRHVPTCGVWQRFSFHFTMVQSTGSISKTWMGMREGQGMYSWIPPRSLCLAVSLSQRFIPRQIHSMQHLLLLDPSNYLLLHPFKPKNRLTNNKIYFCSNFQRQAHSLYLLGSLCYTQIRASCTNQTFLLPY